MPRGDGTGPMGMGSMTGRGAGFCTGNAVPGSVNGVGGLGLGRGFGRGLGRGQFSGRMAYAPRMRGFNAYGGYANNVNTTYAPAVDDKEFLNRQAKYLESQLNEVKRCLQSMDDED